MVKYVLMSERRPGLNKGADRAKETLLNPPLVERISRMAASMEGGISILDAGSGDGTSVWGVVAKLLEQGVELENLGLVDADVEILPRLLTTAIAGEPLVETPNIQLVQGGERKGFIREFLSQYAGKYDVAVCQLVLHQILDDSEASLFVYSILRALKPEGELLVIDLHPQYLEYLEANEPGKVNLQREGDGFRGEFFPDGGGKIPICLRELPETLAFMAGMGFDLKEGFDIYPGAAREVKPRYQSMTDQGVPLFRFLRLRNNPDNFVSASEGVVENVELEDGQLLVTFTDQKRIWLPHFSSWGDIEPGDYLVLHEIRRPEIDSSVLSYWAIPQDPEKKIRSNQVLFKEKNSE